MLTDDQLIEAFGVDDVTPRFMRGLRRVEAAVRAEVEVAPRNAALELVARRAMALMLARDEDMSPKDEHAAKLNAALELLVESETVEQSLARQAADLAEHRANGGAP